MVTRYKSMRDFFEAQHYKDLQRMSTSPEACHMEIESVSDAMDRMNQNIIDRQEENRLNRQAGVQFGTVIVQGEVIKYPEKEYIYVNGVRYKKC